MTSRDRRLRAVRNGKAGTGRGPAETVTIAVCPEPGYVLVEMSGEIDIATVPVLSACLRQLLSGGSGPVVADLDQVSFIDAAGLGVLAAAARLAAAQGASLHVVCARPQTCRLLRVTGLDRLVGLVSTTAEAVSAATGAACAPPARLTAEDG